MIYFVELSFPQNFMYGNMAVAFALGAPPIFYSIPPVILPAFCLFLK